MDIVSIFIRHIKLLLNKLLCVLFDKTPSFKLKKRSILSKIVYPSYDILSMILQYLAAI